MKSILWEHSISLAEEKFYDSCGCMEGDGNNPSENSFLSISSPMVWW
jgi:hypothetical protein